MVRDFPRVVFAFISTVPRLYPSMFVDFHARHNMCQAFEVNVQRVGVKTYEGTLTTMFEIPSPCKT